MSASNDAPASQGPTDATEEIRIDDLAAGEGKKEQDDALRGGRPPVGAVSTSREADPPTALLAD